MIQTITWKATKREKMTDGDLNAQRKAGFTPAIISLRGKDSIAVFLTTMDIIKRPTGNFRLALEIEGEKEPVDCFLKEIQFNWNQDIIHADLQGLTVGQELDIDVDFELIGEPEGLKMGGMLNTGITSVKIRTLPKNIPGTIQVDISGLKIGESINVTDVEFQKEHTLIDPLDGVIASILAPRSEEEEEGSGEMVEPEIITEKAED